MSSMAQKRTQGKISTINRATPAASYLLERYCRRLDAWPRSWMVREKDLAPGEKLVRCFRPFLEELVRSEPCRIEDNKQVVDFGSVRFVPRGPNCPNHYERITNAAGWWPGTETHCMRHFSRRSSATSISTREANPLQPVAPPEGASAGGS